MSLHPCEQSIIVKTTRRKHMTLSMRNADDWDFALIRDAYPDDPCPPFWMDHHEQVVLNGEQEVATVSWLQCQDQVIITQLYVFPPFRNKTIGGHILGCLASTTDQPIRVLCTPNTQRFYEKYGFERDMGHIVVTKVPSDE